MSETSSGLVGTPAAAVTLGVSARTLQRYVDRGWATPAVTLPSGQYRWDLAKLAREITAAAPGGPAQPGDAADTVTRDLDRAGALGRYLPGRPGGTPASPTPG